MFNLSELARGGTMCFSKAGLVSTDAAIDIVAPNGAGVDYAIGGVLYHAADQTDTAMTAAAAQAALTTCIYLVCLDSSGTLTTVKGTEVLTADIASGKSVLTWPQPAASTCPIGAIKVVCASGYTFTCGTTQVDATGITTTFVDLFCVPDAPVTASYNPFA
jgi:hypothetical protein